MRQDSENNILLSAAETDEDQSLSCKERVLSEDYLDFIVEQSRTYGLLEEEQALICLQQVNFEYSSVYLPRELVEPLSIEDNSYTAIPNCYTLLDSSSMQASGILQIQTQPVLSLHGDGVMIGFVDTGIDYRNDVFRDADGNTRIEAIWDQTVQTGNPPEDFFYGSEYRREDIDAALLSDNPLDEVPMTDESGHGTYVASLAAGSEIRTEDFIGAAPQATIAAVRLKEAKQYLRDFYCIAPEAAVYQENDIMLAVSYLHRLASERNMPLVICIAIGTNLGDHSGYSPLSIYLNLLANGGRRAVVIGTGNEANQGHHYEGALDSSNEVENVEVRVSENVTGFTLEFWGQSPDVFSVALTSPTGERVPRILPREGSQVLNFVFENTRIYVDYRIVEGPDGVELILLRFHDPTPGIWTIEVNGSQIVDGWFNMWLPVKEFLSAPVFFLRSEPDSTLTEPSCAPNPISVGGYDHHTNSLYIDSGRGYTRTSQIKPDFVAPAVEVAGCFPGNRFGTSTGTSAATAITAGAAALVMEWGAVRSGNVRMNSIEIKNILVRGVATAAEIVYPNKEWGYGRLDVYNAFDRMRDV